MLLVAAAGFAGEIVVGVGEAERLDVPGNWPRGFASETGWHVLNAADSEYHYQHVSDELIVDLSTRRQLTHRNNLLDHGLARCPDGHFVHVASAKLERQDDTLYAFRYDQDFELLAEGVLSEKGTEGSALDPPAVCGSWIEAGALLIPNTKLQLQIVMMNDRADASGSVVLEQAPEPTGGALYADDTSLWAVGSPDASKDTIRVSQYDTEYALIEMRQVDIMPSGYLAYWTQGFTRLGNYWLLAHMAAGREESWQTQTGNIWVTVLDDDLNVIDQERITDYDPPFGGFHPWITVKDDKALVLFTYDAENWGALLTLDLDAAGVGEDTGEPPDTAEPVDTAIDAGGDSGEDSGEPDSDSEAGNEYGPIPPIVTKTECACDAGGAPLAAWVVLVGLAAARRYGRT